jgi:hypothetical protein
MSTSPEELPPAAPEDLPRADAPEAEPPAEPEPPEGAEPEAEADPDADPSLWVLFREIYFRFDRRTLGVTRILLGFLLVMDILHRAPVWLDMFSNAGVLPSHVNLWRPSAGGGAFTLFNAFSTAPELWALWAAMMATFLCLLVGYRTKVMQILAVIFVTGMNVRVTQVENGGYVVHNLLCLWTAFLPLGDRFSVDSLLASMRARRESTAEELNERTDLPAWKAAPHYSVMGLILLIQLAAIYFFNVIHKTGPAWHDGTAVHYVLYTDRMVTPIVALLRDHLPNWVIYVSTRATMGFEASIPLCLLCPIFRPWVRRAAVAMMNCLHLAFGSAMVLGPFSWALCVFSSLLFNTEDWEIAERTMRRTHRARTVVFDRGSGAALFCCRLLERLDRFELLTFREEDGVAEGLRVEAPDGSVTVRAEGFADVLSALPLGPIVAWIVLLPGVRQLADAVFSALEGGRASRLLGLHVPSRASPPPPDLTPARRALRRPLAWAREVGALIFFAGAVNQACVELWVINKRFHVPQPEPMRMLAQKLRFLQGWFMFSPNPVMEDGTIVVDAITVDGRHIDPFTGKEPQFDLLHAQSLMAVLRSGQIWGDYFNRMHMPGYTAYRDAMRDYMMRLPERTHRPEDALVSGDVFWVQDKNPKWNQTHSYDEEKVKLFSFNAQAIVK